MEFITNLVATIKKAIISLFKKTEEKAVVVEQKIKVAAKELKAEAIAEVKHVEEEVTKVKKAAKKKVTKTEK